jgi:putative phosphotransacetylase
MRKIVVEISARHIHLSDQALAKLFGPSYRLHKKHPIAQPGQFAARETITIKGPKNSLTRVRVIGPNRPKTQLELSLSDCIFVGVNPILRLSGKLSGSAGIWLKGPAGQIKIKQGVIVPKRHLHISKAQAKAWGLKKHQKVSALIKGERSLVLNNVIVRVGDYVTRFHLDTDEANAAGVKQGASAYLDI